MNIVYAGTPDFAVPALQALIASAHRVVAVLTQPDRPAGRGQQLHASPVKRVALAHGLPVLQPATLRDTSVQGELRALAPDLMIVAAYGLILPEAVLNIPRFGCINIHASLLPRWRGAAPIQRAILAGDTETGITIMQMAKGLDTGAILLREVTPIAPEETAERLHDRLAVLGAEALRAALRLLERGESQAEPQNDALANYADKLDKAEAEIRWEASAQQIERSIRAFNPWPVAFTRCAKGVLRIWRARVGADAEAGSALPGTVLRESREHGILVQTGAGGTLWLETLQLPGGKPLPASSFLNGHSLAGQRLGG
ncbi:MAG: methionyl-tRNA formyltransferase [Thiotrichales bacterium]